MNSSPFSSSPFHNARAPNSAASGSHRQIAPQIPSESWGALQGAYVDELLHNYKVTPATLAYKLENLDVKPNGKIRWYPAPHLMYISFKIAMGIAKGNARIIISAPPRHGKSKLCTHYGPLWTLENFKEFNVALITYGSDLSTDFSREVRDSIDDYGSDTKTPSEQFLDISVRKDASRLDRFLTNQGGGLIAIGVGGPFTGRGANVIFIDDYIKTIKEALSETYREGQWDWLTSTGLTRMEPDASVIIIATRWHEDDMIGRILKRKDQMGDWEYIRLPAIAEKNDPLSRQEGEPLFPHRFNLKSILERKAFMGSIFFDAIYQQAPHSSTDKYASRSWLNFTDQLPLGRMRLTRIWDLAGTQGGGDWTVGLLMGHHQETNQVYILNIVRKQKSPKGVENLVKEIAQLDTNQTEILILQDPGSAGKIVTEHYTNNVLPFYQVTWKYTNKKKIIEAQPFLAACEAGRVSLVKSGWNEEFAKEFENFPLGEHDDQVDCAAAGYDKLIVKSKLSATWGRPQKNEPIRVPTEAETRQILQQLPLDPRSGAKEILPTSAFSMVRRATWGR